MPPFKVIIETNHRERFTFSIEVYPFTGVERLKELVAPISKIPVESQRIYFKGKELDEEDYLSMVEYNIQEGSTLLGVQNKP